MVDNAFNLMTAIEAEAELGAKYFYKQRTYRLQKAGKLKSFNFRGQQCFLPHLLVGAYINELQEKLLSKAPELGNARIFYDHETRRMIIDGIFGRYVAVTTDTENEEDLVSKLLAIREWVMTQDTDTHEVNEPVPVNANNTETGPTVKVAAEIEIVLPGEREPSGAFPRDIEFIQVQLDSVAGVEVKSSTLMSLPSIARFIGIRSDNFSQWLQGTTFSDYVVSAHHKSFHGTEISVPWKKGFVKGYTSFVPLEVLPEILITLKQSGLTPALPARAEQLYLLAKSTLEAVGLAISGNQDKAAAELAKVSKSLGISAADQVIEIFKQYESKPFQVNENKKFRSKVNKLGLDIKVVTGEITVGVTGRLPGAWKALGEVRKLPAKNRTSGREVMRTISPEDSVGVTFSESHYLKDHTNIGEVIKTGQQGKDFYKRLKDVGLLDDAD